MEIQQIAREIKPLVMGWMYADLGDGWRIIPYGAAYGSATAITFASVDCTALFPVGAPVRWRQRDGWLYGYVVSAAFSTNTTLTVVGNSVVDAPIGAVWVSHGINPAGFPHWFNWTPTITGYSTPPSGGVYRFRINGRTVFCVIREPNNGISNATTLTISVPVAPINITNLLWLYPAALTDNGISMTTYGRAVVAGTSSEIVFGINPAVPGGFTASGGKRVAACDIWYEI